MDSQANTDSRIYDGYYRKTGKPMRKTAFSIFEYQYEKLRTLYDGTSAIVIRLLLEKFLAGEYPEIEQQLEELKKQSLS
jgi:hypothetical protein